MQITHSEKIKSFTVDDTHWLIVKGVDVYSMRDVRRALMWAFPDSVLSLGDSDEVRLVTPEGRHYCICLNLTAKDVELQEMIER